MQDGDVRTSPIQLRADIALVIIVSIDEQPHADTVKNFSSRHVDVSARALFDDEGKEIQIVISVQDIAIEFDVTLDLQVLARINHRPGRRGEAHASHVEVRNPRAVLEKNVIEPGKLALSGYSIALVNEPLDQLVRKSVNLYYDNTFGLSEGRNGAGENE